MNVTDAISKRRSVQKFDPEHRLSYPDIESLILAAMHCPSAFNIQHWRFVAVESPQIREQLKSTAWGQPQVTDAGVLMLVCVDLKAWDKSPERYWENAEAKVRESMVKGMRGYYRNDQLAERDDALRSGAMAAMTIMLKAQDIGYDSCVVACDYAAAAKIINLPNDHAICMMLTIGKRLEDAYPRPGMLRLEDVLITDTFK